MAKTMDEKVQRFYDSKKELIAMACEKNPRRGALIHRAFLNALVRRSRPLTIGALEALKSCAGV